MDKYENIELNDGGDSQPRNIKKIVYQKQQRTKGLGDTENLLFGASSKREISVKAFNDMKMKQ